MNYIINELPLVLLPTLACMIGLNEAIVVQQIHYWISRSGKQINGKNWVYNTYEDWQKQFPWWSVNTVRRTFTNLEKKGILEAGNFNKMNIDRTKWYTINYAKLDEIADQPKMGRWTAQNGQMDSPKWADALAQNELTNNQIIPDTTTDITTDICSPVGESELGPPVEEETISKPQPASDKKRKEQYSAEFLEFWKEYPRPVEKKRAFRAWKASLNKKADPQQLITAAKHYLYYTTTERTDHKYIKHPSTFLGPDEPWREWLEPPKIGGGKSGKYDPTAVDWEAEAAKYLS